MDLFLGLDGGGTKTQLYVGEREGPPQGRFQCGGTSLSRRPLAEVAEELAAGCNQVFRSLDRPSADCIAACGGFASAGRHALVYDALLRALLPCAQVCVLTDAELAWRGATGGTDGIVVVAGTGSIAWGRRGSTVVRTGGEGPGRDGGSADWIGRRAVATGLLPAPDNDAYAALLPCLADDPRALPIFSQAGAELAALLVHCARDLGWFDPVAYAVGGVFDHVPAVLGSLRQAWPHPIATPRASAVEAALQVARSLPATGH